MQTSLSSSNASIAEILRPSQEDMARFVRMAMRAFSGAERPDFDELAQVVNSIACLPWIGSTVQLRLANRLGAAYDVTWPLGDAEAPNLWSVGILRQSALIAQAEVLIARIEDPSCNRMSMIVETTSGSACFSIPVYHTQGMMPYVSYEECELADMPDSWNRILGTQPGSDVRSPRHTQVGAMMAIDWFNNEVKRYGESGKVLLPAGGA